MKILVACEESQRVCIEFRKKGHEAYSCDTQECSGGHPEWHIKEDVLLMLDKNITFFTQNGDRHYISEWDMIIAFPPGTYMTKGGAVRMYKTKGVIDEDRYKKARAYKEFFLKFYDFECSRVIIENPIPMKCIGLPRYSQIIQPYMFGEPYSKNTCLCIYREEEL